MAQHKLSYVTSAANPLLVRLRKHARHGNEYRRSGEAVLEGEHLCLAWAERGGARALHALVAESAWQEGRYVELAAEHSAATVVVPDDLLAQVSTLESPAPLAFVVPLPAASALEPAAATVVFDQLQDAGNVGSILRSAAAFGYRQVIALAGTVALWSPKVLRAAMGAHFSLRLHEGASAEALAALALPLLGTSSHTPHILGRDALPEGAVAWLFGNEGAGLRSDIAARCHTQVRIDQPGGQESLNVAAAAAICLHATPSGRAK